jgi:hypothetical protein
MSAVRTALYFGNGQPAQDPVHAPPAPDPDEQEFPGPKEPPTIEPPGRREIPKGPPSAPPNPGAPPEPTRAT